MAVGCVSRSAHLKVVGLGPVRRGRGGKERAARIGGRAKRHAEGRGGQGRTHTFQGQGVFFSDISPDHASALHIAIIL